MKKIDWVQKLDDYNAANKEDKYFSTWSELFVYLYFEKGMTYEEMGDVFHVSSESIRRLHKSLYIRPARRPGSRAGDSRVKAEMCNGEYTIAEIAYASCVCEQAVRHFIKKNKKLSYQRVHPTKCNHGRSMDEPCINCVREYFKYKNYGNSRAG